MEDQSDTAKKGDLRGLREKAMAEYGAPEESKARMQRLNFLLEKSAAYVSFVSKRLESKCAEKKERPVKAAKRRRLSIGEDAEQKKEAHEPAGTSERQPKSIVGVMRNYQLEGMEWLASLYENGLNGILADEMGLGKTLQTIAFLCYLRERKVWGPFMVVCPLSTLSNWISEFVRFAPETPVLSYHGTPEERQRLRQKHLRKMDCNFPIVLTTYEITMRDRQALMRFAWKFLIIDEGHRIKNMNCKLIRDLKSYQSANRLLLTGTPLQNSLSELWSLLNFLLPDIFDDLDSFQEWFDFNDINEQEGRERIISQETQSSVVTKLHRILQPFLLRRLKVDVEKHLPPKREYLISCPMAPLQYEYYQAVRGPDLRSFLESKFIDTSPLEEDTTLTPNTPSETKPDEDGDELSDLEALPIKARKPLESLDKLRTTVHVKRMNLQFRLMQQRKVCQHPYLFDFPVKNPCDPESEYLIDEQLIRASGKLLVLDRLLPELFAQGHRVLIFSQFARVLDILECYAELRRWAFCRIDGSIAQSQRQEAICRFNTTDVPLFFLTTRSGGLGINLTAADTVVLFDSDWNPQQDLQAQDRVHRIGQQRPVIVYRLVIHGSCENAMIKRARAKRKLEKLVIHQSKFKGVKSNSSEAGDLDVAGILMDDDEEVVEKDQMVLKGVLEMLAPGEMVPREAILTDEEVRLLTDRSPQAYSTPAKVSERVKELEQLADEQNDILAKMQS
ncbi:putative ATPase [Coemansia sp. RSA 1358]|uniref:ATPase n=1 Tax=Coemansia umbellata TaxID=1424467 RepID=A0ABQ8PX51_9FUNG|nr:putative ATPase [Coemansia umbellata]KAJ2625519.1 putative ATPase [Coemansia sp. RSA 1358]